MKVIRYKLQLVRVEGKHDGFGRGVVERGAFLKANGEDVAIRGYAAAATRAGELNNAIKTEGKWDEGWRFHIVQETMEEQQDLFDVESGDQANAPA